MFTGMWTAPKSSKAARTIARPPSSVATELVSATRYTAVLQDLLGPSFCRDLVRALAIDGPAQIVDDDVRATRREQQSIFAADSSAPNETP